MTKLSADTAPYRAGDVAYTDHVRLAQCPTQIATLDGTIDQLENEYEDVTRSLNLAKAEADSLNACVGLTGLRPPTVQACRFRAQSDHRAWARTGEDRWTGFFVLPALAYLLRLTQSEKWSHTH
jgi:hypothetical protein